MSNTDTMTEEATPLSLLPENIKRVEAGLTEIQRIYQERTDVKTALSELTEKYKMLELECDSLRTAAEISAARADQAEAVKMQAVAERVAYETVFRLVLDAFQKFTPPVVPAATTPSERP